ncbi:hypothetical protein ILUMI_22095, partial [Ignelater luminosus]
EDAAVERFHIKQGWEKLSSEAKAAGFMVQIYQQKLTFGQKINQKVLRQLYQPIFLSYKPIRLQSQILGTNQRLQKKAETAENLRTSNENYRKYSKMVSEEVTQNLMRRIKREVGKGYYEIPNTAEHLRLLTLYSVINDNPSLALLASFAFFKETAMLFHAVTSSLSSPLCEL